MSCFSSGSSKLGRSWANNWKNLGHITAIFEESKPMSATSNIEAQLLS